MRYGDSRDDYWRIRAQQALLSWPETDQFGGGVPSFLGKVTSSGSAIGVGKFLMVQPTSVLGAETEGGAGTFQASASPSQAVLLVGPGVPSTGDYLVCRFVDHRWVAERTNAGAGGGPGHSIPGCTCTPLPSSLTMTSFNTTCNFQMFQSCSLTFGPPPAAYSALDLGGNLYVSNQSFPDPLANNSLFQYILTCHYNQFNLSRIYATTPFGSPFRDGILYTWLIGGYGNTCHPFHLDNGVPYSGSDASCNVQIDG